MIVWGTKLYGKVDEIEGVGYVATQFGHLFWIPLIPYQSYFVTAKQGHQFEGIKLGLWSKSVLVGYLRAASLIFFFLAFGAANSLFNPTEQVDPERITSLRVILALGIASLPAYILTKLRAIEYADEQTEVELVRRAEAAGYGQ